MNDIRDWFVNSRTPEDILRGTAWSIQPELLRECVQHLKDRFMAYSDGIKLPADSIIEMTLAEIIRATIDSKP